MKTATAVMMGTMTGISVSIEVNGEFQRKWRTKADKK